MSIVDAVLGYQQVVYRYRSVPHISQASAVDFSLRNVHALQFHALVLHVVDSFTGSLLSCVNDGFFVDIEK